MTLRTRFTLAVAAAVAAVALAITAVAFLVVRADLSNQVKHELQQQTAVVEQLARHYHGDIPAGWVPQDSKRFGAVSAYAQVVTAYGTVWAPAGDTGLLPATSAAQQVAADQYGSYYTETTMNGVRAMVLTTPLAPGLAVQLAVPLTTVDTELGSIGGTLVLLSAAGVALAALAGWGVARAGLAPVGRLAAVAEQVTATGDPGRRVEVDRTDELGRLAASFNTMLGALQRSLGAQRQLVSDASHELRTPLTSLRVNAELLASEPGLPEAERQEVLDRIVAQVEELGQLVAGVTELAKGEALDAVPGEVDLAEVVAAALEGARRDWPRTVFRADLEPNVVLGDGERLKTAVRNLLDNAAKFSPPGSPVEVRLHDGELSVRDHGPGIPPDDIPHVFDRFYRAASARSVPGSGLGLSIVRQVTESHGGTVEAEVVPPEPTGPGGGTLVRLRLPRPNRGTSTTARSVQKDLSGAGRSPYLWSGGVEQAADEEPLGGVDVADLLPLGLGGGRSEPRRQQYRPGPAAGDDAEDDAQDVDQAVLTAQDHVTQSVGAAGVTHEWPSWRRNFDGGRLRAWRAAHHRWCLPRCRRRLPDPAPTPGIASAPDRPGRSAWPRRSGPTQVQSSRSGRTGPGRRQGRRRRHASSCSWSSRFPPFMAAVRLRRLLISLTPG
jgi:two-component system, OmpR family, sensor histidine kinase MprB